jgi:hypothetical protein
MKPAGTRAQVSRARWLQVSMAVDTIGDAVVKAVKELGFPLADGDAVVVGASPIPEQGFVKTIVVPSFRLGLHGRAGFEENSIVAWASCKQQCWLWQNTKLEANVESSTFSIPFTRTANAAVAMIPRRANAQAPCKYHSCCLPERVAWQCRSRQHGERVDLEGLGVRGHLRHGAAAAEDRREHVLDERPGDGEEVAHAEANAQREENHQHAHERREGAHHVPLRDQSGGHKRVHGHVGAEHHEEVGDPQPRADLRHRDARAEQRRDG